MGTVDYCGNVFFLTVANCLTIEISADNLGLRVEIGQDIGTIPVATPEDRPITAKTGFLLDWSLVQQDICIIKAK